MRLYLSSTFALLLLSLLGFSHFGSTSSSSTALEASPSHEALPVNALLGNESYRAVFNTNPTANSSEQLRLQTHLAVVEAKLRQRDMSHLSEQQRENRSVLLDELRTYWTAGQFPQNTEVPGRSPVFIDEDGRLCAVGHLIAASSGRSLAETIDERYHLTLVRDMNLPALDRWAERHGFTKRELGMIQPTYNRQPVEENETETASALEVTTLSASVGASLLNGVLLELRSPSMVGSTVGVVGGATSLSLGVTSNAKYSTASILSGTASMVLGGWSLIDLIRGEDSEGTNPSSDPVAARNWKVGPTTITTVDGATRPGIQASVQF